MAGGTAGAIRAGRAFVELFVDDRRVQRGLNRAGRRIQAFGRGLRMVGYGMVAFSAAAAAPFVASVQAAGDAIETINKFEQVFGRQAAAAAKFGDALAKAVGRSRYEMRDSLASFHAFFVGLGFGADQARKLAQNTTHLALDFASLYNLPDADAFAKFQSALAGLPRAVRAYGINVLEGAVATEAFKMGITDGTRELSMQEKAFVRYSIILKTMTAQGAVGDAIRTADKYINRMKALRGALYDLRVEIGNPLIPVVTRYVDELVKAVGVAEGWVRANKDLVRLAAKTVLAIGGIGVAFIIVGAIIPLLLRGLAFLVAAILFPIKALIFLVAHIVPAFLLLQTSILFLLSPLGMLSAAVLGAGLHFLWFTGAGAKALAWLGQRFVALKNDAVKAWGAIAAALVGGDINAAAEVLWLTLKLEWARGITQLKTWWNDFTWFLADMLAIALGKVQELWVKGIYGILSVWEKAKAKISTWWETIKAEMELKVWQQKIGAEKTEVREKMASGEISQAAGEKRLAELDASYKRGAIRILEGLEGALAPITDARDRMLDALEATKKDELAAIKAALGERMARGRDAFTAEKAQLEAELAAKEAAWEDRLKSVWFWTPPLDPDAEDEGLPGWLDDLKGLLTGMDAGAGVGKGIRTTGTFSAQALFGLGAGKDVFGRTATATEATAAAAEETAKNTARTADEMEDLLAFE